MVADKGSDAYPLLKLRVRAFVRAESALRVPGNCDDPVTRVGLRKDHTHGVPALRRYPGHGGSHHLAPLHDHEHLVLVAHDHRADQIPPLVRDLSDLDPQAATTLGPVLV